MVTTIKSELHEVRKADKPWFEIARNLEKILTTLPAADRSAEARILGRAAGVAPAVVRRYLSLLGRMREISKELGVPEDELLSPSFNSQEVAARIYARSKTEGTKALRLLANKQTRLAALQEALASLPSPTDATLRSSIASVRKSAFESLESALQRDGATIFGEGARARRRPKLQFIGNAGYEIVGDDGSIAAGIDLMIPDERLGFDFVDRNLKGSLALAPFFPKFYLAFSGSDDDNAIDRLVEVLEWLEYDWIGVLRISPATTLEQVRAPSGGPTPDLSARYESYVRKFSVASVRAAQRVERTRSEFTPGP